MRVISVHPTAAGDRTARVRPGYRPPSRAAWRRISRDARSREGENGQAPERQAGGSGFSVAAQDRHRHARPPAGLKIAPAPPRARSTARYRRGRGRSPQVREAVRREARAIAEARMGIHHDDRKIMGEHGVLKPSSSKDDIGARPGGGARARKPVLGHPGLREGGEKQRLVSRYRTRGDEVLLPERALPAPRHARA
jgi:hypothetical protein